MKTPLLLLAAAGLLAGCHTVRTEKSRTPMVMSVETAPIDPAAAAAGRVPAPQPVRSDVESESVYRQPVLKRVFLEPYTDENGNAYGPQVKYVLEDPGGWNMEALRNPSRAYIPPAMSPSMAQPGSVSVASTVETPTPEPTKSLRELYNLDSVIVTGFVERGQEPLAQEQARELAAKGMGSYVVYYDDSLGFLLVPRAALQPVGAH